jgi:signal peptidase I
VPDAQTDKVFDQRTFIIRSLTRLLLIAGIAFIVKFFFIDSTTVRSDQMNPSIYSGDHILIFKTFTLPVLNSLFHPSLQKPILFKYPSDTKRWSCLRIVAVPGDVISIDSGIFKNSNTKYKVKQTSQSSDLLPKEFSPRDFVSQYKIPEVGDTLPLDSLKIRDFFFALSLIRQESPEEQVRLIPVVTIDDSVCNDYIISGFSLFSGSITEIPDTLQNYWFFWIQLENYLKSIHHENHVSIKFTARKQDVAIHKYVVKKRHYFLLADNWESGYDSRYFGLVNERFMIGRPFMIWWSTAKASGLKSISRIGRMIL